MKKITILGFVFFFFCEFYYSQNLDVKKIITTIISNKKTSELKYINIDTLNYDIDRFVVKELFDDFEKEDTLKSIYYNAFCSNSVPKSVLINWNNLYDSKIRIIDKNNYKFPCENNIYRISRMKYGLKKDYEFCENNCSLIMKRKILWSKKKTRRKIDEFWGKYDKQNPKENYTYYEISNPLISENNDFF